MYNFIVQYKQDFMTFATFVWLQIAPSLDMNIFQDQIEPVLRAIFYVISWVGGAFYVYFRAGKAKAERREKIASAKIKEIELDKLKDL